MEDDLTGLLLPGNKVTVTGGSWSIEAGALPLADGSGLVIDEFDKLHNEDKKQLNDSLSNVESLFCLSKAEAQLALSSIVTLEHLDRAAKLLNASILQIGMDEAGNLDADIIAAGRSKSQRDKIMLIHSIIRDLFLIIIALPP